MPIRNALGALDKLPTRREPIFIAATETGRLEDDNNMGSAVMVAHIIGELFIESRIKFTQFWNTRWSGELQPQYKSGDALDNDNKLLPVGRAIAMMGAISEGQLVKTSSSDKSILAYVANDKTSGTTPVILINRGSAEYEATLEIAGTSIAALTLLAGTGESDMNPRYTHPPLSINNTTFAGVLDR